MKLNMKSVRLATLAGVAALALGACATSTAYGPAEPGGRYGYSEQRIQNDRYRVTFAGNSITSRDMVEMSLLLRSAELTVQSGYDWFSTVERATDRDTRFYTTPDPFYYDRYGPYWSPRWRFYRRGYWSPFDRYWMDDYDVRQVDRYEATAEIVMGRGAKPAGDPNAFDAREVIDNIGPRVRM
ncbi:MAG TPA: hypothetical protein VGR32_07875 [Brevundimonas sp.]|uniref:CC0125/CC1285 family lipoprotein n=1 Tax=Brevundimonas sp. TaxID=1871086 RepID=UPI002DEA1FC9|nr:hypothetical protein [Brevundimonas sp.]